MLSDYGYISLFLVVVIGLGFLIITIPVALRFFRVVPHRPTAVKNATYECGLETIGKTWVQFNFRYYYYALLFIALDVMVVFLYPWAVSLRELGTGALVAVLVFVAIITTGYLYAWKKGVLEWQ
ncbi:MAG: NADH-quinone oxidoreductase subunit A [Dehalococcoidales bacterium]